MRLWNSNIVDNHSARGLCYSTEKEGFTNSSQTEANSDTPTGTVPLLLCCGNVLQVGAQWPDHLASCGMRRMACVKACRTVSVCLFRCERRSDNSRRSCSHPTGRQNCQVAVRVVFGKAEVRQLAKYKGKCSFFFSPIIFKLILMWGAYCTLCNVRSHVIIIHAFHKRPSAVKTRYYRTDRRHLCSS